MQFSHSRIECFNNCKYQYKLRYLDKLKTIPDAEADNPLILGTSLHEGIEKGAEYGLNTYFNSYPIITDKHINESIKLEYWIEKAREVLPIENGFFEKQISNSNFIGFIDLLAPTENENEFDLYDFKYSNNQNRYMESGQLHEYKYFFEKCNPGMKIRNLFFVFIPKIGIRQKKTENLYQFRKRLENELNQKQIDIVEVKYNPEKVIDFTLSIANVFDCTVYSKNITKLCDWCEYYSYCLEGENYMILPSNERRTINNVTRKKIWLYGKSYTGKTYLANKFPEPLMLNTDGNIQFVDAPFIPIKDKVIVEGRQTKRTSAWQVFKETIAELEKKENTFKTIIVDLLEDCYEHCRSHMFDEMKIDHESDAGFGKGYDIVNKEFLDTIRNLMNLDYENIILISHEDRSKDLTQKSGDKLTSIAPNIKEKLANKIAGMVDFTARTLKEDGEYILSFKTNEIIFGGGRLTIKQKEIPSEYSEIVKLYEQQEEPSENVTNEVQNVEQVKTVSTDVDNNEEPRRRKRRE